MDNKIIIKKFGRITIGFKGKIPKRLLEFSNCLPDFSGEPELIFNFHKNFIELPSEIVDKQSRVAILADDKVFITTPYFKYLVDNIKKLREVHVFARRRSKLSRFPEFFRRNQYKLQTFSSNDDYLFEKNYVTGILPFIQLAMMQKGQIFIHASSIRNRKGAIAFTGVGGCGKSSLALNLIKNYGFDFLSDDMTPVDEDLAAYYNPRHITVLPYNVSEVSTLKKLVENFSLPDKVRWKLLSKVWGNSGISKKVLPEVIFPNVKKLKDGGSKLNNVVFIQKWRKNNIKIRKIDADILARFSRNIMLTELREFALDHLLLSTLLVDKENSNQAIIPWIDGFVLKMEGLYKKIFEKTNCFVLFLPDNYHSSEEAAKFIVKELDLI